MNVRVGLRTRQAAKVQRDARRLFIRTQKQSRSAGGSRIVRRRFLGAIQVGNKKRGLFAGDFVDRAVCVRDDVQIAVRSSLNVGGDAEVAPNQKAFAFSNIEFIQIVGHQIVQSRIGKSKVQAIRCQLE